MALWQYTMRHADGREETNILGAGNRTAALARAKRNANAQNAELTSGPDLIDPIRGSM